MRPKNYKTGITNLWWEPAKFLWKTMTLFYHLHVINVMWKLTLNFCTICVQIQIFFDEKSLCYFQRWGSWFSTKPSFYGLKEKLALKLDMTKNQTPIFIHSVIYELQYNYLWKNYAKEKATCKFKFKINSYTFLRIWSKIKWLSLCLYNAIFAQTKWESFYFWSNSEEPARIDHKFEFTRCLFLGVNLCIIFSQINIPNYKLLF